MIRLITIPILIFTLLNGCSTSYQSTVKALEGLEVGNGIALHPNQNLLLISKPTPERDDNGKPKYKIFAYHFQNEKWRGEQMVSFSSEFTDYHPVFSPDGEWIYFNSNRPIPGDSLPSQKINIWRVQLTKGAWGMAEYLYNINTENHESYPSVTADGSLFFNSDRSGGEGSMDIYKAKFENSNFSTPINIRSLNSSDSENDLTVSPDESYIVFNRYHFDTKEVDLYISKNENGIWSQPEPIKSINQKDVWELTPTFSPDGRYFFYEINGRVLVKIINDVIE